MDALATLFFTALLFCLLAGFIIAYTLLTLIRQPKKRVYKLVLAALFSMLITWTGYRLNLIPDLIIDWLLYIIILLFVSVGYLIFNRQVKNDMGGSKPIQFFTSFILSLIVIIAGGVLLLWISFR